MGFCALPPSTPWRCVDQMISDVLSDLIVGEVRSHLFSTNGREDAAALSGGVSALIPRSFSCTIDSKASFGFQDTDARHVQLYAPAWRERRNGVTHTCGSVMELNTGEGAVSEIFREPQRNARYVSNKEKSSTLVVYVAEKDLEFSYRIVKDGWHSHSIVWINRAAFEKALTPNGVDLSVVQLAITKTIVGGMRVGPNFRGDLDRRYPTGLQEYFGPGYFGNVVALYANAVPLLAMPVFASAVWGNDLPLTTVHELMQYGFQRCLHGVPLSPERILRTSLPPTEEFTPFVSIAPAHADDQLQQLATPSSVEEDIEADRIRRAERRRIQNRIAAARSNARRRQARLSARRKVTQQQDVGD